MAPSEGPQSPVLSLSPVLITTPNSHNHNHQPDLVQPNFVSRAMYFDDLDPVPPAPASQLPNIAHQSSEHIPTTSRETPQKLINQSPAQLVPADEQEDPPSPALSPEPDDSPADNPLPQEHLASYPSHFNSHHHTSSQNFESTTCTSTTLIAQTSAKQGHREISSNTSANLPPIDDNPPSLLPEKALPVCIVDQTSASHDLHIPPLQRQPAVNKSLQICPNCHYLTQQNVRLERRGARLRMRLHDSIQTAQTHGQRLLRAAFQDKLRELTVQHAQRTTEMLNIQKKCFEDELEVMESETQSAMNALQKQLAEERDERDQLVFRYERERDDILEKTESTMQAVQRKLAQMHARANRLESEKDEITAAHDQKQLMIEVLASTAAAKDVERHRLVVLENGQEEERKRKNSLIDSLQREVADLRKRLEAEVEQNRNMTSKVARLEKERRDDSQRHEKDIENYKQEAKKEIDRMGRLFASMIQDFAEVPSNVSTAD